VTDGRIRSSPKKTDTWLAAARNPVLVADSTSGSPFRRQSKMTSQHSHGIDPQHEMAAGPFPGDDLLR
jgi:hypothetical protein